MSTLALRTSALLVVLVSFAGCKDPPKFDPSKVAPDAMLSPDGDGDRDAPAGDGARLDTAPGVERPASDGGPTDGVPETDGGEADAPVVPDGAAPVDGPSIPPVDGMPPPRDTTAPPPDTMGPPPDACASPTDPRNCGSCGNDCSNLPNLKAGAAVSCVAGQCQFALGECRPGFTHCSANPADGCEVDLGRPQTCGGCNTRCNTGESCIVQGPSYQCVLACTGAAPDNCNGKCTNRSTDPQNCGTCGKDCAALPHLRANPPVFCQNNSCALGSGACAGGWGDCNNSAADGCETDLSASANCGMCGMACTGGKVCAANGSTFSCVCPASAPNSCGNACVNFQTDAANCGTCGKNCAALPNLKPGASVSCSGGQCVVPVGTSACNGGFGNCNTANPDDGCETTVNASPNCGGCSVSCSNGQVCGPSGGSYSCGCPASMPTTCGNSCVDLNDSGQHCGTCNHSCLGGPCGNGKCQPLQIYAGSDPSYAQDFDSTYYYFIRDKTSPTARVISRMSKNDGSGLMDIWAADIGEYRSGLVIVNGMMYWSAPDEIRGCPTPSCAGGPQVQVPNQLNVYRVFSDVAGTKLFWIATDPVVAGQDNLMTLGRATPLASTSLGFSNGTADGSYVYLNEGSDQMVRIPVTGGGKTSLGAGYDPVISGSRMFFDVETPATGGGSSPAIWTANLDGSGRQFVGNYDESYSVWGGIVADSTHVYWAIWGEEKGTTTDYAFIFKCPISGCGTNPTILVKSMMLSIGTLMSDGQALYTGAGYGIFKLAK